MVIGVYIFYNLVYALLAFPAGIIADKLGLKKMLVFGLIIFSVVYAGMSVSNNLTVVIAMFFLYGLYAAATEGVSKALISNIVEKKDVATALGVFAGFQSICLMIASSLTGFIWYQFGAPTALMISAVVSITVAIYFLILRKRIA
jgi:MFS family permease